METILQTPTENKNDLKYGKDETVCSLPWDPERVKMTCMSVGFRGASVAEVLSGKHRGLSLIPSTHVKSWWACACL